MSDPLRYKVYVGECSSIYVPNAFTPNADGTNDTWFPIGVGWESIEVLVFDRWGVLVFRSVDPKGQWNHPGEVTRIPASNITMEGVNYPVLGVPDRGEPIMMQPGAHYDFPGANYVDEYPQMKAGGALLTKKVTCKDCGWKWEAADGGNDITTCHKCGGQGLVHAQKGLTTNWQEPNYVNDTGKGANAQVFAILLL